MLTGDVHVDGEKLGKTGKTLKVSVCGKSVELRHNKHGTWTSEIKLREKKTTTLTAKLGSGGGPANPAQPRDVATYCNHLHVRRY